MENKVNFCKCPNCGSEEIDAIDMEVIAGEVYDYWVCAKCQVQWKNIYKFDRQELS